MDLQQPQLSAVSQKVQLTYKLFLLENARNTFEQELRNFTHKAYEEVEGFLTSSFPGSVFTNLTKAVDVKCQAITKLSVLLKDMASESHVSVQPALKNGVRRNQLNPIKANRILVTDVLKFGPMLHNSLMACSIAKTVQVLGATLSPQNLKLVLTSQSLAAQPVDLTCSTSSMINSTILTKGSSSCLKSEQQKDVCEDVPPADPQCCTVTTQSLQPQLPPIKAVFPEISNPKPLNPPLIVNGEHDEDVQVQHHKQTSCQLLHFLKIKGKNINALEISVMQLKKCTYTKHLSQPVSPTRTVNTPSPKTLDINIENKGPIFRIKRGGSCGSLIYSCVIATETELWDIGNIFTKAAKDSEPGPLEGGDYQNGSTHAENSSVNIQQEALQCTTEPEQENNNPDGINMPIFNAKNIPEFHIQKFEETEVVVSHIVSPGHFYIQRADSFEKLQALVTDSWKASSSYAEQNCIPDIGTQVMGWFPKQEQWCRAKVIKICGVNRDNNYSKGKGNETSVKVAVKRLDFGDTACLSLWNVKEMTLEMADLPLQAVQVSLAKVTPLNGRDWTEEAVSWFKVMVHNRTLYARLYPQGSKVTVELFLEKGKLGAMRRGASLSLRLAQNGHAKHMNLQNAGLRKMSAVQLKKKKQDADWEKYLISRYTQSCK